jgi:putative oxidoreductase
MTAIENGALLLGRLLLSWIFVSGGWSKLLGAAGTQAYFAKLGLPLPEVAWVVAVVVELGGGLAILFGIFTRFVGIVMAIWCVATALAAHTNFADRMQEINFYKNMAMTGGFLYVAVVGAGAWSLDGWWFGRARVPGHA